MAKVQDKEGIPASEQFLMFAGHELSPERKLSDYYIQNTATIQLATRHASTITVAQGLLAMDALRIVAEQRALAAEAGWRNAESARQEWSVAALRLGWQPATSSSAGERQLDHRPDQQPEQLAPLPEQLVQQPEQLAPQPEQLVQQLLDFLRV